MRILIISDIHANLTALDAVLDDAGTVDAVWCLGDLVGYGPDPNESVERVRSLPNLSCILGNHDAAALNLIDAGSFNPEARQAILWTQEKLSDESRSFLKSLPEYEVVHEATLAHGSPRMPVWEYLLDTRTASDNFEHFDTDYCFVGHTHLPVIFSNSSERNNSNLQVPEPNRNIQLIPRAIINPGSVGQPRDRDPRSAYGLFDPERSTYQYRRVIYDVEAVQARMAAQRLPERHIMRLGAGW
jgi:predicted phosphodiesterase